MIKNKKMAYAAAAILLVVLAIVLAALFSSKSRVVLQKTKTASLESKEKTSGEAGNEANIPNPAAVYCGELGYKAKGDSCVFPDNTECGQWDFFKGKCGQKFTFCGQQGFRIESRKENTGAWTAEYAVCVFNDGSECQEQEYFKGRCEPSQCQKWSVSEGGCVK